MSAQGSTRSRMLREVLEALDAVCAAVPLVLVLEDLHWADDSTLDLVAALLRRREDARLLLLGTFRREGEPAVAALAHELVVRGLCEELEVGRLAPEAVAAHLELRFPSAPLPDGLAAALARRSGGNPLFMRNLLEHWLAEGTLEERSGAVALARPREGLEAGVPPTLQAHIRDQLDVLERDDAELLSAASVAGRDFSADTVAAALERDRDDVATRCAELARRTRLIERRDGGHAFPHDLYREVLYELLPPDARARLHARVGAHLADTYGHAATGMAAELGFHFLAGRDPERAVRWLRLAAERAFRRNAHNEGIRHLRAALDAAAALDEGSERTRSEVELFSSLGQALVATGGWSATEAEDALLRARGLAERLSDNEPLVSVLLALATLYELRGEFTRASDMARECEQLAPSGSSEHELESAELLACNLFHQGSFARALEYADRGVELFDTGAPGSYTTFPATLGDNAGVSCHDWAGLALWFLGRPDSALARATRALELARDPSRAYSLATARAQMAVVHQCRREPQAVYEWAEATIASAARLGYVYREAMGRVLRGWALAMLGDAPQAVTEITAGLAASRGTGRADGRPVLPRAAGRGAPARRRARGGARGGRGGAGAVAARALAVLRAGAAPARRRRCTRPPGATTSRRRRCGSGWRGRASRARRRWSCGSRPTWRGCRRLRRRSPTRARRSRRSTRASRRGWRRATYAMPRPCSALTRSRRRRRAPARARRAPRGRRRTPPWSGA